MSGKRGKRLLLPKGANFRDRIKEKPGMGVDGVSLVRDVLQGTAHTGLGFLMGASAIITVWSSSVGDIWAPNQSLVHFAWMLGF